VRALIAALGLSGAERTALEATVTRSRAPQPTTHGDREPLPAPLPLSPTPLVDRAEEIARAQELLRSDGVRLLTLTGPAGVGKTRLALQVARGLRLAFPDGVWFVDLSSLQDPALVLAAIAEALHVQVRERRALPDALGAALGERQVLLVLDNFEPVLAAAPQVAGVLGACPGVKLLVTSRVRLRLLWEHTLPVGPLPIPGEDEPHTLETLAEVPAVACFVERAQAANPAFALTAENAPAVAALCRHLDGLPLALELAAARANMLTPAAMLQWVEHRLPALGWDAQDRPARHQSLGAALDGSYGLLSEADQALFRRLAVFAGVWTPAAAAAVAQLDGPTADPVEAIGRLVDASLVQVSGDAAGSPQFRLLETVREYAAEHLDACGEREAAERSHAAYFLALAEQAEPHLKGPDQVAWYRRLLRKQDNFRAALAWAAAHDETETELRLVAALAYFWWAGGGLHEARQWFEHALARSEGRRDPLRGKVLAGAGLAAAYLQDFAGANARLEEAQTIAREAGDPHGAIQALTHLAIAAWLEGRPERLQGLTAELA
jgi:predicted ATPase